MGFVFSVGVGVEDYSFSGLTGPRPWDDIHSLRFGMTVRWARDERWTIFGGPTVRSTIERGASLSDGVTGGGFAGFTYKFSDRLTLGSGFGVLSQIEDSTSVFPFLLINWNITDRLALRTGGGLASTLGPGLTLAWRRNPRLELSLIARTDRTRFRLDDSGPVSGGVGQDRSFGLYGAIGYRVSPLASLSGFLGASFNGALRLEDQDGRTISHTDYDPAINLGLTFRAGF